MGLGPKLFAAGSEVLVAERVAWPHLVGDEPAVVDPTGKEIVREKLDHWPLIPGRGDRLLHGQRFVAFLNQLDFARSIVEKVDATRGKSNLLTVDLDHRPGGIGRHDQTTTDAPAGHQCNHRDQRYVQTTLFHGIQCHTLSVVISTGKQEKFLLAVRAEADAAASSAGV